MYVYVKRKPRQIVHRISILCVCVYAIRFCWLVEMSLLKLPTISFVTEGWRITCTFTQSFTHSCFTTVFGRCMHFTDGRFLLPEIYVTLLTVYRCINTTSNRSFVRSFVPHAVALFNFYFVLSSIF